MNTQPTANLPAEVREAIRAVLTNGIQSGNRYRMSRFEELCTDLAPLWPTPQAEGADEISFTGQGYNIPDGGHINLLNGCASLSNGIVERISARFPGQKGFAAVITLTPLPAKHAHPSAAQKGKENQP
jgi:hypothetical protein